MKAEAIAYMFFKWQKIVFEWDRIPTECITDVYKLNVLSVSSLDTRTPCVQELNIISLLFSSNFFLPFPDFYSLLSVYSRISLFVCLYIYMKLAWFKRSFQMNYANMHPDYRKEKWKSGKCFSGYSNRECTPDTQLPRRSECIGMLVLLWTGIGRSKL